MTYNHSTVALSKRCSQDVTKEYIMNMEKNGI